MRTTVLWGVTAALVSGVLLVTGGQTAERPLMRDLELEALQEAVRWPEPDVSTVLALVGRFVAAGRDQEALCLLPGTNERCARSPAVPRARGLLPGPRRGRRVPLASDRMGECGGGQAQRRGRPRSRGPAVLPRARARRAPGSLRDDHHGGDGSAVGPRQQGPLPRRPPAQRLPGPRARVHDTRPRGRGQGGARTLGLRVARSQPCQSSPRTPGSTPRTASAFCPPRLVEMAPGVYVAQGYDFADIAFVLTDDGVVAIDAGTTEANARTALAALRRVTAQPITHVLVTHAHWDHIGGLPAFKGPGTQIVAQARFAEELRRSSTRPVCRFRYFLRGAGARQIRAAARIMPRGAAGDG